jgi:hypothetical protein
MPLQTLVPFHEFMSPEVAITLSTIVGGRIWVLIPIRDLLHLKTVLLKATFKTVQQQQQEAFYSHTSWGRLERNHMSKKKRYKTRAKKKGKIKGDKKNQIKKRRKDNKMLSQKSEKGPGKELDKRQ